MGVCIVIVLTCVAYLPAIRGGFIWDDDDYVTKNPLLTAPDGLKRIWFSHDSPSQYFPLVYTMFRMEHAIWGLEPVGYHLVNVVLHIANALLLWLVLSGLQVPGAWFGAVLWAIHPVNVESVAWITERKNTLSTLLYLASLFTWIRFIEDKGSRSWIFYVFSLILFQFALFAKTTVCTLPAALLIVLWLRGKQIDKARLVQVVPYVVLGASMAMLTIWWERHHQGTRGAEFAFSITERILIASRALWFYAGKLLWPYKLVFSYPKWKIDASDPVQYLWLAGCLCVGAILVWKREQVGRGLIAAIVFFVTSLMPTLGFVSLYTFRYTFVADHYQYVACMGLLAIVGGIVAVGIRKCQVAVGASFASVLILFGVLTWNQAHAYKDAETLWRDTIAKNPRCAIAHNNLANILDRKGNLDDAMMHYYRAIEIDPTLAEVHLNLAIALTQRGRYAEAAQECRKTIELCPEFPDAHYRLGVALARQGMHEEALQSYMEAIRLKPDYAEAYNGMGVALVAIGRLDEAIQCLERAMQLKKGYADAHNNMAAALYFKKRYDEARKHIELCRQFGGHPHPGLVEAISKKGG